MELSRRTNKVQQHHGAVEILNDFVFRDFYEYT